MVIHVLFLFTFAPWVMEKKDENSRNTSWNLDNDKHIQIETALEVFHKMKHNSKQAHLVQKYLT